MTVEQEVAFFQITDEATTTHSGMVITIDGPAGTGKSSVALEVARRLGLDFLDTGAMYRAIGLEAIRRGVSLTDEAELAYIAKVCKVNFDWKKQPPAILLNGEDVGHLLRSGEVTRAASFVAVVPAVREVMVHQQRAIGREHGNLVTEGRDQGTVVFPDAEQKFFLTATAAERAKRRAAQLRARGEVVDLLELQQQIESRDYRDATRPVAPLSCPADAVTIDTTKLTEAQVIEQIISHVKAAQSPAASAK
jgi:cytidylate kinase